MINIPLCSDCWRFDTSNKIKNVCKAYPGGIPEEILIGKVDHRRPYKGDHGILFEGKETLI